MGITASITRPITRGITRAITSGRRGGASPSFNAPLKTTLVPTYSKGSGTPTFTRATTSYVADSDGILRQAVSGEARFSGARRVRNGLTYTEDFSNAAWVKGGTCTVSGVDTINLPADGDYVYQYGIPTNATVRNTVELKADAPGTVSLEDASTGTAVVVSVTTSWQRFSSGAITGRGLYIAKRVGTTLTKVYARKAQTENVTGQSNTNPSEYVSVGVLAAPFHGAGVDGSKYFATENGNTVASNVVTEATGAALTDATLLGFLAEGQRTNLALWSNDLTNVAWTPTDLTPAFTATGPDGAANSASTLTATAANGTILQSITSASAARVTSCWIKRRTGTGAVEMTQNNGTTWAAVTVTAGWTQVAIAAATAADPIIGFRIVTSGDAVDVWCVQHEVASFASSAIPTTTASVTRNADVLSYPLTANFSNTAGSAYAEAATLATIGAAVGNDVTLLGIRTTPSVEGFDGANNPICSITGSVAVQIKIAAKWGAGAYQVFGKGSAGTATAYDGTFGPTSLQIGNANGGVQPFANVRNVRIYPTALPAAQLVAMTT